MAVSKQIFKAYDIRGKVGSELNPQVAKTIGQALAEWLPEEGAIAVGRDMRPDSKELSDSLIEGIRQQGRDVVDIGEVTSDMIYFAVGNNHLAGGAMVTASHNPGEYNGIKLCQVDAKPIGEESGLFEIRDLAIKNVFSPSSKLGELTAKDIDEDWIDHVLSFVDVNKLKSLNIAVDAGNGMAGKIFAELEPYVPFAVTEMYFELDGTFPNHIANPLDPKNIVELVKTVTNKGLDAGLAFDGDGDRAVLIDEKGEPLSGSVMTAMLAKYFLTKFPGATILYNVICGRVVPETIEAYGGKGVRCRVGHSFIKGDMRKYNAVFAGEHSGHYYFKDNFMADSGLIAAIVGLYLLSESNQPLSQIVESYRTVYVQIHETNFEVSDKEAALKRIAKVYEKEDIDWLDGLSVNFKNAWFNVRPSNTEPLLRFNAEAKTKSELDDLVKAVTNLIKSES